MFVKKMGCSDDETMASPQPIMSVEFEVFGKVQGVAFTKFCCDHANHLNVVGWVKNSKRGTIVGKMQGRKNRIENMSYWLANKGSPDCVIENVILTNVEYMTRTSFKQFEIRF